MRVQTWARSPGRQLDPATIMLLGRLLSPLCGLDRGMGFFARSRHQPRFATLGADLTGVHILSGQPKPTQDAYHIGGSGVEVDEAVIRALGETVERYCAFVGARSGDRYPAVFCRWDEFGPDDAVLPASCLRLFADEQHASQGFPFHRFREDLPLSWTLAPSLLDDRHCWLPTQLLQVGYVPRHGSGERRLAASVTTGTAAHTNRARAALNALLELVQIDAAMGHWYSGQLSPRIMLDGRTAAIAALVQRQFRGSSVRVRFHWLPSPDLLGMPVACVLTEGGGRLPAVAVGLGCELALERALYKAMLEAVGVAQLAKLALYYDSLSGGEIRDEGQIHDLNRNVGLYARPGNRHVVESKFPEDDIILAADLPADIEDSERKQVGSIIDSFRLSGKRLYGIDLTTPDAASLGFVCCRAWSPDTLALALPSLPPAAHPRFSVFGGVTHARPHPYP
jgi:thiazole/oxazole-forming peptide maturase SagD family component